jgi:hypothetical protein
MTGIPIQFRHFIPRDEELKFFIATDTPLDMDPSRILKVIESEMMEYVDTAREDLKSVTKAPKEPNWDLKREFERRNRLLDRETFRAIARHAGRAMEVAEEEDGESEEPEEPEERKEEVENVVEDEDEDEPVEFREARAMMANISRGDLNQSEELE